MLEIRPNCEYCDKDLPAECEEARICSYECTFCKTCAEEVLHNVCPNCGGGFARRPIRPAKAWRDGICRSQQPPSTTRKHLAKDRAEVAAFVDRVKATPPAER